MIWYSRVYLLGEQDKQGHGLLQLISGRHKGMLLDGEQRRTLRQNGEGFRCENKIDDENKEENKVGESGLR